MSKSMNMSVDEISKFVPHGQYMCFYCKHYDANKPEQWKDKPCWDCNSKSGYNFQPKETKV